MLLDISRALHSPGEQFPFMHRESLAAQDICGEAVTFDSPVLLSGHFFISGDSLVLRGTLQATARSRCTNCLDPAKHLVSVDFDEVFLQADKAGEETAENSDRLVFEGTQVELSQLTLTLALLDLPLRFLCKPDCMGFLSESNAQEPTESQSAKVFSSLKTILQSDQEV
jgi:uncharacterized protein